MNEHTRNPFDPSWYRDVFDDYDDIDTINKKIEQMVEGIYKFPDADGSRSSELYKHYMTSNSFVPHAVRDTLKEVYSNTTYKLKASNHDEVQFRSWRFHFDEITYVSNSDLCEIRLVGPNVMHPENRDKYKRSQLYRKWITIAELLNNYDIFGFDIKMFINQRICRDYEFHFDDHETKIRFSHNKVWKDLNHEILIYKYPIQYGATLELTEKLYNHIWKKCIPFSAFKDQLIIGKKHAIISYHRRKDERIRNVDFIDDNLEFHQIIQDGIDISNVSLYNKNLIETAILKPIDIFITVPKYMHEYPFPIVTDHLYRPYKPNTNQVFIDQYNRLRKVKTNQELFSNVYYDQNGLQVEDKYWVDVLRPLVLSDAYKKPSDSTIAHDEKYKKKLMDIRDASTAAANVIEQFRLYMEKGSVEKNAFFAHLESCDKTLEVLHRVYTKFLESATREYEEYDSVYNREYKTAYEDIKKNAIRSEWLKPVRNFQNTYWKVASKLIYIPRRLVDLYTTIYLAEGMKNKTLLKESYPEDSIRFQRPIDTTDFWTFCYDEKDKVWRPYMLSCEYRYPDVYLFHDEKNDPNKIFRVLFFYSDSINVLNEDSPYQYPVADWMEDTKKFTLDLKGSYHDIFIEKMYWSALHNIYSGLLYTDYRWELIEYVMENPSYDRFNKLFLQSMDPYFKLSIASYIKEGNLNFPFDAAIDKIKESFRLDHLGYAKVNNYERYLHHSYKPSYYDYKLDITDDFKFDEENIIHRPPSSFDLRKVFYILDETINSLTNMSQDSLTRLKQILSQFGKERYNLNQSHFQRGLDDLNDLIGHVNQTNKMLSEIDVYADGIDVYLQASVYLSEFSKILKQVGLDNEIIDQHIKENNIHHIKVLALTHIDYLYQRILPYVNNVFDKMISFETKTFMDRINDLTTLFRFDKINDKDDSLIYKINQFNDPWSVAVKRARNRLFQSTSKMYGLFDTTSPFTSQGLADFQNILTDILSDIRNLRYECMEFWNNRKTPHDQEIISRLDYATELIPTLKLNLSEYIEQHNALTEYVKKVEKQIQELKNHYLTPADKIYLDRIIKLLNLLVRNVSYINDTSGKRKKEIEESIRTLLEVTARWIRAIEKEKEFFKFLEDFSIGFNTLFEYVKKQGIVINHICDYINTLEITYVPDKSGPSYTKLYQCDDVEVKYPGHFYEENDLIIGKHLGGYHVSATDGSVTSISKDASYYNKTFTNPNDIYNYTGAISSNHGFGLRIHPKESKMTNIIMESLLDKYMTRGKILVEYIMNSSRNINAFQNTLDERIFSQGAKIFEDYDKFIEKFRGNIRETTSNVVKSCYENIAQSVDTFRQGMALRTNMNPLTIYHMVEEVLNLGIPIDDPILHDAAQHIREVNHLMYHITTNKTVNYTSEDLHEYCYGLKTHISKLKLSSRELTLNRMDIDNAVFESDGGIVHITFDFNYTSYRAWDVKIDEILNQIQLMETSLNSYDMLVKKMGFNLRLRLEAIQNIVLQDDVYYQINETYISDRGKNYRYGDIIVIDNYGQKYAFIVTHAIDGRVYEVEPMMNYALADKFTGLYDTTNVNGNGEGCTIKVYTKRITSDDIQTSDTGYTPKPNQYQDRDLYRIRFANIKENPNGYEVFIGGKQIREYYSKRIAMNEHKTHYADALYFDINMLNQLKDSHIHIPEESYYIYGVEDVRISRPGKGYFKGQSIRVRNGDHGIDLYVSALNNNVFGEIADIALANSVLVNDVTNPSIKGLEIISSRVNNIDDEYHNEHRSANYQYADDLVYDKRHPTYIGTEIPKSKKDLYTPINASVTDDKLPPTGGTTNASIKFKHDMKIHTYNRYERIKSVIPETDPFIPYIDIIPTVHPRVKVDTNPQSTNITLPETGGSVSIQRNIPPLHIGYHKTTIITNPPLDKNVVIPSGGKLSISVSVPKPEYFNDIRLLTDNPQPKNEFKSVHRTNLHCTSSHKFVVAEFEVDAVEDLFKNTSDANITIGDRVAVKVDKNHYYHRTIYTVDSIYMNGDIVYTEPYVNDRSWNEFYILWNCIEYYPTYKNGIQKTYGYIDQITKDDIGVYNWTLHRWEDIADDTLWALEVVDDPSPDKHGFKLKYLNKECHNYSMELFLFKSTDTQFRNALLVENATVDVYYQMLDSIYIPQQDYYVNTGRNVIVRKLFPYYYTKTFKNISNKNHVMTVEISPEHVRTGHLLLQDVKLKNLSTNQFENILDFSKFSIRFKDMKSKDISEEINTYVQDASILFEGNGFNNGLVYAYNRAFDIYLTGYITTTDGKIATFKPIHTSSYPTYEGITTIQFHVYQTDMQDTNDMGIINIIFNRVKETTSNEGYIYNVTNPYAPLPNTFEIIPLYDFTKSIDYQIIITKQIASHQNLTWEDKVYPKVVLSNVQTDASHIYLIGKNGRLPQINPSTKEPTFYAKETENGTEITINDTMPKGTWIDVRILPYAVRSVYTLYKIPKEGYLDLEGVLNKPLSKNYYEFWVNGRLMDKEVAIITPTKVFFHGLTSLRNLEILEIDRDYHERLSDAYVHNYDENHMRYNFNTYLDDVLDGDLVDHYTLGEQKTLIYPVWPQVSPENENYKQYPPNMDIDPSVFDYVKDRNTVPNGLYKHIITTDIPSLNGVYLNNKNMRWSSFGMRRISDIDIVNMFNTTWEEEIHKNPYLHTHRVLSEHDWYGQAVILYDVNGNRLDVPTDKTYTMKSPERIAFNTKTKLTSILK